MKTMTRFLAGMLLWSVATFAGAQQAATLQDIQGEIHVQSENGTATPLVKGQAINAGAQLVTGENSQAVIRFNDGHMLALKDHTAIKIASYMYNQQQPQSSSFVMELIRGGLRSVTGLLGKSNPQAFKLYAGTATIGIRGTDFMVSIVNNSTYTSVSEGTVAVTGSGGSTVAVGAGQFAAVSPAGAVAPIGGASVPVGAFGNLPSVSMTSVGTVGGASSGASGAGSGAAGASGAATGAGVSSITAVTAGSVAAATAAAVAAAASADQSTGTTGTR